MNKKNLFSITLGLIFILGMNAQLLMGQKRAAFSYTFDGCNLQDATAFGDDAKLTGNLSCGCGIGGDGLKFSGNESLELGGEINQIFTKDFSIDFYVNITSSFASTDILSIQSACSLDSSIYLKYLPQTKEIIVEISEDVGEYYVLKGPIGNSCWNRITLTKSQLNYALYINNELAELEQVSRNIPISRDARLRFSGSPCTVKSDDKFVGVIDEVKIYNSALSRQDLQNSYVFPDQVVNIDTTILKGNSVDINVGATCFDNFTWTPTTGLSNPSSLSTSATPMETTTYELSLSNNGCEEVSSVTINVIEADDKDCSNLLIPAAFTPNGDNLNDALGIANTFIVDRIESFEIYDRWGGYITRIAQKSDRWDGTKNGSPMPGGSYFYKISYVCDNQTYGKAGSFLMLK